METTPFRDYQAGTQPPYDAPEYGSTHKRHPQEALVRLPHTITETSGPRFSAALFPPIADLSVVNGKAARDRLVCKLDMTVTEPEWALGYRWDVALRGRASTPME